MRRAATASIALAALLAGCALLEPPPAWEEQLPPPAAEPVVPAGALHRFTLPNHLDVLVLEDHRLPRIALGLVTRRGAASEESSEAGLAGYTVELMQRGAGSLGADAFAEAVDSLGASLGGGAGWDSMSLSVAGLSRDTPRLGELLATCVRRPRFDPDEAGRLRSERLAALQRQKDDPRALGDRWFADALFDGHRYGLPLGGTPETVSRLDGARARAFHARTFVPSGSILYAVGDIDAEAARRLAEERFGDWSGPAEPAPVPAPPAPTRRHVVVVDRPELSQANLFLGHEGPSRTADDRIPAQLMNAILGGGGFSSRMMTRVREKAGLAYYAYSYFDMRREGGVFVATTATRVAEVGRVAKLMLDELEGIRSDPPDQADLRLAQGLAAGHFAIGLETSDAVAGALVDLDVYGLPRDSLDTYRRRVAEATTAGLAEAARRWVHPERATILAVGPADALKPQLEPFGEVRVIEP